MSHWTLNFTVQMTTSKRRFRLWFIRCVLATVVAFLFIQPQLGDDLAAPSEREAFFIVASLVVLGDAGSCAIVVEDRRPRYGARLAPPAVPHTRRAFDHLVVAADGGGHFGMDVAACLLADARDGRLAHIIP